MQGNVRATSEVGTGTTFTVTLPSAAAGVLVGERQRRSGFMN
jgi:signal transduction histidine kinase